MVTHQISFFFSFLKYVALLMPCSNHGSPIEGLPPPLLLLPRIDWISEVCVRETNSLNESSEKFLLVHLAMLLAIPVTSLSSRGEEK